MNNAGQILRTYYWQLRVSERRTLLLVGDFVAAFIAWWISIYYWGVSERFLGFTLEFLQKRVPVWFYLLPFIWLILMVELYDVHRAADWGDTVRGSRSGCPDWIGALPGAIFLLLCPSKITPAASGVASFLIAVFILTLLWRRFYLQVFTGPSSCEGAVGGGREKRTVPIESHSTT